MKIKKIKFQNYTVFEEQQIEFSPGVNIILAKMEQGRLI